MLNPTVARNAAALIVSDVLVRGFAALGAVLVARSLGPEAFGMVSIALAFSAIIAYVADVGITQLTVQQVTKPSADVGRVLGTVYRVRLVLVAAACIVSSAVILLAYQDSLQRAVLFAVVLPTVCGVAMQGFASSYFWATQQMHITAGLKMTGQIFAGLALILAFLQGWPVLDVAIIYGLSSLVGGIACLWLVRKRGPKITGWDPKILKGLSAFTLGGIAGLALPQLGPLVLERVASASEVGYFAAASRVPTLLHAIPGCLATAWYPQLFRAGYQDPAQHFTIAVEQLRLNVLLGLGLSLPLGLYSGLLTRTVFGPSWEAGTAHILSVLCWMVVLNSASAPFADALSTMGMQKRRATSYLLTLAVGVILAVVMSSAAGAFGAAAAAIATQLVLNVSLVVANPRGRALSAAAARRLLWPAVAGTVGALLVWILLAETLFAAAASFGVFTLSVFAVDRDLRASALRIAEIVGAKWRYACQIQ